MASGKQYGGEGTDLKGDNKGLFSTGSGSYKGPENWTPEDKGRKDPDNIQKRDVPKPNPNEGIPG